MTEKQSALLTQLGVYGCWLLKYGKTLPDSQSRDDLMYSYSLYHKRPDNCSAAFIMYGIDRYCKDTGHEKPASNFDEAVKQLGDLKII